MKRWDAFRDKREKFIDYFVGLKNKKNRSKFLVTVTILQKILRYFSKEYNELRNVAVIKAVRNYKMFKIQFRLKRLLKKRGETFEARQLKKVKNCLLFIGTTFHYTAEKRAMEDIFLDFMQQTAMRNLLKKRIIATRDILVKVQRMRKNAILMNGCKLIVLIKIWAREQSAMSFAAIKSKDKKQRQLVSELSTIRDDVKVELLKKYLFMCSVRHSLAFYQWRNMHSEDTDVRE